MSPTRYVQLPLTCGPNHGRICAVDGSTTSGASRKESNMASEHLASTQSGSTAVALFQKAHGRLNTLQRIDDQVSALLDQRRKIQDELRAVQALINEEFDRVVKS